MQEALCQEPSCSVLLLVIQLLFEQRILTGELAVRHIMHCLQCSAQQHSAVGGCSLPGPVLRCTVAGSLCEQQLLKLDTAVPSTAVRLLSAQEP